MSGREHAAEIDVLWLCNSTDHNRFDAHDYRLVHDVVIPTDRPCPETLRRLALVGAEALREAATALGHVYQADSAGVTASIRFLRDRADRLSTPSAQSP